MNGFNDFSTWPLVLHPTKQAFHNVKAGIIELKENENLRLACSGADNHLNLPNNPQVITIKCIQKENFFLGESVMNFYDFSCRKTPESAVKANNANDFNYSIGYYYKDDKNELKFIPLIDIKYDNSLHQTIYTRHTMFPKTKTLRQNAPDKMFSFDGHPLREKVIEYTNEAPVHKTVDAIIGEENRKIYFKGESRIAKGHMAAKVDFPFYSQQIATFHFLNVNPQFQGFNGGNWDLLEDSIAKHDFGSNIEVLTIVQGVLNLKNKDIFFGGDGRAPLPLTFHKTIVSHNEIFKIVGYNHPNSFNNPDEFNHLIAGYENSCNVPKYSWFVKALKNRLNNAKFGLIACF